MQTTVLPIQMVTVWGIKHSRTPLYPGLRQNNYSRVAGGGGPQHHRHIYLTVFGCASDCILGKNILLYR